MNYKGFTLIELLVVISIISILTVVFLISNPFAMLQKGRDVQRKSDLGQIQKALESYYNDNSKYPDFGNPPNAPGSVTGWAIPGHVSDRGLGTYLQNSNYFKSVPKDPKFDGSNCNSISSTGYLYFMNNSDRQRYTIFTRLENTNDLAATSAKPLPSDPYQASRCGPDGNANNCRTYTPADSGTCGGVVFNYWVNSP